MSSNHTEECVHEKWGFPAPAWSGGICFTFFALHAFLIVGLMYYRSVPAGDAPKPVWFKTIRRVICWQFYRFVGGIVCQINLVGPHILPRAWSHPLSGDITVGMISLIVGYIFHTRRGVPVYCAATAYLVWAAWDLCAAAFTDGMDPPTGAPKPVKVIFGIQSLHGWMTGWLLLNATIIYVGAVIPLWTPGVIDYFCSVNIDLGMGKKERVNPAAEA